MSVRAERARAYAEASRTLLRDSVLDAVGELLADDAWADVTMAAVAERAGVSRQTLYNAFGNREELAQAYLMREAERFLAAIEDAVSSQRRRPAAGADAQPPSCSSRSSRPTRWSARSATQEGEELVALATTRGGALLTGDDRPPQRADPANWPEVDPDGARLLAATLVRLAISHAVLPTGEPEATAADIGRTSGPFIDELPANGTFAATLTFPTSPRPAAPAGGGRGGRPSRRRTATVGAGRARPSSRRGPRPRAGTGTAGRTAPRGRRSRRGAPTWPAAAQDPADVADAVAEMKWVEPPAHGRGVPARRRSQPSRGSAWPRPRRAPAAAGARRRPRRASAGWRGRRG